jgi:hypothetical protein
LTALLLSAIEYHNFFVRKKGPVQAKTTRRGIIEMLGVVAGTAVISPLLPCGASIARESVDFPCPYLRFDPDISADISYKGYEVGRCNLS